MAVLFTLKDVAFCSTTYFRIQLLYMDADIYKDKRPNTRGDGKKNVLLRGVHLTKTVEL